MPSIATEPYFTGTSYVMIENGRWRMWYLSCTKWDTIDGKLEPFYHIKYAESKDGLHWERNGVVAIDYKSEGEGGIVSASILKEGHIYKMWYAYRDASQYRTDKQKTYRIGYAKSADGIHWARMDEKAGIILSEHGWDSEMMSYPNIVNHQGESFLFYNGNGFGKSGFGYAQLKNSIL